MECMRSKEQLEYHKYNTMKGLLLLTTIILCSFQSSAQTIITRDKCHLLTDKYNLYWMIEMPISEVSIDIIPKGSELQVLEIDSVKFLLARVVYKKKTGWIHRNMVVDRSVFINGNPGVRDGYADAIRNRKVIYGMNEEEVELAIGIQNKETKTTYAKGTKIRVGFDIGYTTNNYIAFNGSIPKGFWYYGLSMQVNMKSGVRGKSYDKTLNWNTDLDGVSNSGSFYTGSYGFDLGYYFKPNLCIGGGVGYAHHKLYRNFHDNMEILSKSGWYHVTKGDGGKIDAKAFIQYYFKEGLFGRCYLKGQYSIVGGAGACIGFQI